MRRIHLSAPAEALLRRHLDDCYPLEGCGLLIGPVGSAQVTRCVPCPNVAPAEYRGHVFEIEPSAYVRVDRSVHRRGEQVLGFYHSHPGRAPVPSDLDTEYAQQWPNTVWLIVSVDGNGPGFARAWWWQAGEDGRVEDSEVEIERPPSASEDTEAAEDTV